MNDISKDELEFIVFCVENIGQKIGMSGDKVYELLARESHILKDYILPNFEVLHTQSKDYIVSDIVEYMEMEGVLK